MVVAHFDREPTSSIYFETESDGQSVLDMTEGYDITTKLMSYPSAFDGVVLVGQELPHPKYKRNNTIRCSAVRLPLLKLKGAAGVVLLGRSLPLAVRYAVRAGPAAGSARVRQRMGYVA